MLLATALAVSLAVIPVAAENSAENERYIYTYLTTEMGLNTAAACGIMANIYYETNFTADISASGYYGLFMYWSGLTNELINWCANNGQDRTTVQGQMAFFKWKMENSYQSLLASLRALSNTANDAYNSADMFCRQFERPANMDYECSKRGSFASGTLFPRYYNGSSDDTTVLDPDVTVSYSATVTASSLNVRSGPGTSYPVSKSLPRGTKVDVVSETGSWCKLSTGGWVSKTYLSKISDSAAAPEPDPEPTPEPDPAPDASTGDIYKVTASSLYVRSGAGIGHSALGFLYLNDKVTIVDTGVDPATGHTWGKLSTGGWASLSYMVKVNDSAATPPADDSGSQASGQEYKVTASVLYVRSGAGISHSALGFLHLNDKVTIVDTGVDPATGHTWGKLSTGGWASLSYMEKVSSGTAAPPAENTGKTYTVTASALNIRNGAGSGNAIIGLLWRGSKVTVVSTAKDSNGGSWGQLSTGGWVSMTYLK